MLPIGAAHAFAREERRAHKCIPPHKLESSLKTELSEDVFPLFEH